LQISFVSYKHSVCVPVTLIYTLENQELTLQLVSHWSWWWW